VVVDEGQAGDICQLLLRFLIDIVGPDLDGNALRAQDFLNRHGLLQFPRTLMESALCRSLR
jgi:hypothetical protein